MNRTTEQDGRTTLILELALLLALALIGVGFWMMYAPLAYIVVGALLLLGVVWTLVIRPQQLKREQRRN